MAIASHVVVHDVFISYAEADRAWVDGFLLDALDQAGASFHSEDAFALGVPRLVEFERAIQQSRRTLLVLSPAYLADTFGQFVDVLVNSYGMETATWPVIPLILQPVELPPRLSQLVMLDASTPEAQQAALVRLCAELKRPVPGPAPLPDCPYPGMVPFDEADSARFFGREQEIAELLERLRLHPFLAVIGASGSGKSSLVRAGLIPVLRKSRLFGAGGWVIRTMRPGEAPLDALAAALGAAPASQPAPPDVSPDGDDLLSMLLGKMDALRPAAEPSPPTNGQRTDAFHGGSSAVFDAPGAAAALLAATPDTQRLLLLVDQFEETFTVARRDAADFQQALLELADAPGCYVALTARADFYADLMASPLWEQIQTHRAEVVPLSEAGLRRAIVRPAEQAGVAIEGALVERLLSDAAGEPGVLPLIQETLVLLWERLERRFLPMRAYEALVLSRSAYGGLDGGEPNGLQVAIARRADATLASLTPAQQAIARRIFLRLIQFGQGRADTRRQQPVGALRSAGDEPALFDATLQRLAESRLLTLSGDATTDDQQSSPSSVVGRPSSVKVDISHEALIRGWPTLQGWLSERREGEQTRRRLEDKAQEWVRLGRANGGLLDEVELLEAERWLESPDADEMGFDEALPELVVWSRAAIEQAEQEKEAARQRELEQAQALAEAERKRAEEQAAASKGLRRRAVFLGVALVAAVAAVVVAGVLWFRAGQRERQARAGELAAQSKAVLQVQPPASLLLAREAINVTLLKDEPVVVAAKQALYDALNQPSSRILDSDLEIDGQLRLSDDGHRAAAIDRDGSVRIWDLTDADPNAKPLVLRGSGRARGIPRFSPDGRRIAVANTDDTAWVWNLDDADPAKHPLVLAGVTNAFPLVAFSNDGRLAYRDKEENIHLLNLSAPDPLAGAIVLAGRGGEIDRLSEWFDASAVAFSPDGRWLGYSDSARKGRTKLWDTTAADPAATIRILPANDHQVRFSPGGHWLAISSEGQTRLWNMATLGISPTLALPNPNWRFRFSPDERWLVTPGAKLWDLQSPDPSHATLSLPNGGSSFAFSPNSHWLAISANAGQNTLLIDLTTASDTTAPPVLIGAGFSMTFSADSSQLLTNVDNIAMVWDLAADGRDPPSLALRGHTGPVRYMGFSADGRSVVTADNDHTVRQWDLTSFRPPQIGPPSDTSLLSEDGGQFVSMQSDGQDTITAQVWNQVGTRTPRTYSLAVPPQGEMPRISLSADGRMLAIAGQSGPVLVWNLATTPAVSMTVALTETELGRPPVSMVFSPDGGWLALGTKNDTAIWDLAATPITQVYELSRLDKQIAPLAISPDKRFLVASYGRSAALWDLTKSPNTKPIIFGTAEAGAVFSSDGRRLLLGGLGGSVSLWDLRDIYRRGGHARQIASLNGHEQETRIFGRKTGPGTRFAFHPDPQRTEVVTVADDQTVRLWDLADLEHPIPIVLPVKSGYAAFSTGGQEIITLSSDGSVRRWPLLLGDLLQRACATAGRNLTWSEWQQSFNQEPYRQTCANLPPHLSYLTHLLDDAGVEARAGKIDAALATYATVHKLDPQYAIAASYWNSLCWQGALWGRVKDVQDACGRAVAMAPDTGDYRDSRGLMRALIGDTAGAIEDFQAYIDWATSTDAQANKDAIAQRQQWIAALRTGGRPITDDVLKQLREAEQ